MTLSPALFCMAAMRRRVFTCRSAQIHAERLFERLAAVLGRPGGGKREEKGGEMKYCCVMLEAHTHADARGIQ